METHKKEKEENDRKAEVQKCVGSVSHTVTDGQNLTKIESNTDIQIMSRLSFSPILKCCFVRWLIKSTTAQRTEPKNGSLAVVRLELATLRLLDSVDLEIILSTLLDYADAELKLAITWHQPKGLEKLQEQTKFTRKELQSLYRGFKSECPGGLVDEDTFIVIFCKFFPQGDASRYAHFLFNAFDINQSGSIHFEDFVIGLSVILRGSVEEKLNWAFNLYDINKDGLITKKEMLHIVKSIYDMMGRYTYPGVNTDAPYQHVEIFFQKMDTNRDGIVTKNEFIETCQKDENIMASMQMFDNMI